MHYQEIVKELYGKFTHEAWKQLLSQIQEDSTLIAQTQLNEKLPRYSLTMLIRDLTANPPHGWFECLNPFVTIVYEKSKKLLKILYKCLPMLASKYIQVNHSKLEGLQGVIMNLYNHEYSNYNASQKEKSQLSKDAAIRKLYEDQLSKEMSDFKIEPLHPIGEVTNANRNSLKNLLFYVIYREAAGIGEKFLQDYYRAIFIYCGAEEIQTTRSGSLYLLEKNSTISIFRYSISEEELEWIILTLYELCTQVKKDKFELLAVINLLHKKVSNESLFKISEVVQSLIHLLEDEYSDVFI